MKYQESFDFLLELLKCESVTTDVPKINQAVTMLKGYLEAKGLFCAEEDFDGRHALFASTRPGKVHKLLFNAHLDVVPPSVPHQFEPRIEDGKLYARGAGDCKGNAMAVAQVLLNVGKDADVSAIFTTDEEDGGVTTGAMAHAGYVPSEMAVVADGGSMSSIVVAQKGIVILKLVAHGHGGHSSAPWAFDNPIYTLVDSIKKLQQAWKNPVAGDIWHDSMAPCILRSGFANNQIPDDAEAIINIRFTTPGDEDRIIQFVKDTTGLDDVTAVRTCPPVTCPAENPLFKRLADEYMKIRPNSTVNFDRMNGATDARHLTFLNLPIAITSMGSHGAHANDEYIPLQNFDDFIDAMTNFARSFK